METKIKSIVKTYDIIGVKAKHTGYFIVSNNHRLKHVSTKALDKIKITAFLPQEIDQTLSNMTNAQ